jgi:hypothetical protein
MLSREFGKTNEMHIRRVLARLLGNFGSDLLCFVTENLFRISPTADITKTFEPN